MIVARLKLWGLRPSVVWIALAIVACQKHETPASPADELVATINDGQITRSQFKQQVERSLARYTSQGRQLPPGIVARIEESVMRRMVDDAIVEQKAESLGVGLSSVELDAKFKEHKDRFRTEQAFDDYLQRSNNTEAALREDLRKNMLRDQVIEKLSGEVGVTDADVEVYYNQNKQHFVEPEQMRARRILLTVPMGAEESAWHAAEIQAQRLATQAQGPRADFSAMARQYGKGPEASRDGDLSVVVPDRMPELDRLVAAGLKPGHLSKPVKTAQGWALFHLDQHHAARQKPLGEVHESIKRSLLMRERNERRQAILHQLKSDAKINVRIDFEPPPPVAAPHPAAAPPTEATP